MGSITYRRQKDLGDLMQSCHVMGIMLWISTCFSPTSQNPASCIISSSGLSWSDSHASTYMAHPPAPALLRLCPTPTFRMQLQVLKEQASFLSAPISLPSSFPHPLSIQPWWLCGGPFSPLSICTYWSLCPRAREQCARTQKVEDQPCCSLPLL